MNSCFALLLSIVTTLQIIHCHSKSLDTVDRYYDFVFKDEDSSKIAPPEPCQKSVNFCGEDESKYPSSEIIESLISSNSKVQQWIQETADSTSRPDEEEEEISSEPRFTACTSRREKFPSFGRSMNIGNKWKYIIDISHVTNKSSNADILICERPGDTCLNDSDSPHGESTTVCRQAYRNQRLLALDKNGEASIDSFPLPSGCICHLQNNVYQRTSIFEIARLHFGLSFPTRNCQNEKDSQIHLKPSRIRRDNDNIVFPDDPEAPSITGLQQAPTEFGPRSNEKLVEEETAKVEVTPCSNNEDFCELLPSYPKYFIDGTVNKSNTVIGLQPEEFNAYHSTVCQAEVINGLRIGFPFGRGEVPLCVSSTYIMHPQKGKNINGIWRHIVNTDLYKQGVSMEKCVSQFEGKSCRYDGKEGLFPEATICKQQYSRHPFVVVTSTGEKIVELFDIATACVCHIQDDSFILN